MPDPYFSKILHMTPVILPRRHPYLHSNGVMAVVPPNPLTMKIMAQRRIGQGMAPARRASERRGQKINVPHDFTLQGNCSHRTRRRTATPEASFFAFLFLFSRFHPFTANVTRALPLEAIKGRQGPERSRTTEPNRKETMKQQQLEPTQNHHHHPRDLGPAPSLKSL
jgi:hypothetical protein